MPFNEKRVGRKSRKVSNVLEVNEKFERKNS